MRVLALAGLITVAIVPFAAAEDEIACQPDDLRRTQAEQRLDQAPLAPSVPVRPAAAQREAAAETPRQPAERRRSGKPIPDAQLIQPRGAL